MKRLELNTGFMNSPLMNRIRSNQEPIQKKLSGLITAILIATIGWILGQIVWLSVPSTSDVAPWKPSPSNATISQSKSDFDLASLQQAQLFGLYNEKVEPVKKQPVVQENAPKTRLNLTLAGVVASSNPNRSLAIISNRGTQSTYGLNEKIEGTSASLKAVFVDRVIIDNQGRDETLMLDGQEYKKNSPAPQSVSKPSSGNADSSLAARLDKIRAELAQEPKRVFNYISISEVKRDGATQGYRLAPGRDAALFNESGLKPGDIAVQLNGIDLTEPGSMVQLAQEMNDLQELNLTVDRDGQQYDIYIQF